MKKIHELLLRYRELILYIVFGGLTTLVSWLAYALFVGLCGMGVVFGNILSWVVSVLFAFVTNKLWVFQSRATDALTLLREGGEFFLGRAATGALSAVGVPLLLAWGLDQTLFGVEGMLAKIVMSVLEILLNYVLSKLVIFRRKKAE